MSAVQQGFTLIELLVAVVVAGVLVSYVVPGFLGLIAQVRHNRAIDTVVDLVNIARNEAIYNGRQVVLCASDPDQAPPQCNTDQTNWNKGWLIYRNCVNSLVYEPVGPGCDPGGSGSAGSPGAVIRTFEPPREVTQFDVKVDNNSPLVFLPSGRVRNQAGDYSGTRFTITVKGLRKTVIVNAFSRIRIEKGSAET